MARGNFERESPVLLMIKLKTNKERKKVTTCYQMCVIVEKWFQTKRMMYHQYRKALTCAIYADFFITHA